jgi:hypothetical protein
MYFSTKSYLKNTRNHTAKHTLIAHSKLRVAILVYEYVERVDGKNW